VNGVNPNILIQLGFTPFTPTYRKPQNYFLKAYISVRFSEQLHEDKFIVLKIDSYYNSLGLPKPPPSVDCLIIVKCDTNICYDFYLVELKNIGSPKHLI